MKLSRFLLGTLACTMLAACSNEEAQESSLLNEGGQAYMAINLVAPNALSRAFEEGTGDESTIGTGRFYFFDENGTAVTVSERDGNSRNYVEETINFDGNKESAGTDNVESTHTVLVLDGNSETPAKMLVVLNPPSSWDTSSKSLDDLLKLSADYETSLQGKNLFVMSNSVYMQDDKIVNTVDNIASHISTSAEAAENNPVDVYVERVLAKVDVTEGNTSAELNGDTESMDTEEDFGTGANNNVMAKIKGWTIAQRSDKSYLIKHVDSNWYTTSPFYDSKVWNDPTNYRSYWAQIPDGVSVVNDKSYNEISGNFDAKYCQERTGVNPNTVLLVTAELQVGGVATTIAKYAGELWTLDDLETHICGQIQNSNSPIYYSTNDGTSYQVLTKDQIKFRKRTDSEKETIEAYESVVELESGCESYSFAKDASGTEQYEDADAVKTVLNFYKALVWDEGKTYYYVPIEHSIGSGSDNKLYGVVRNHYYKINVTGVHGLGTPIPPEGDDDDIVPETPTDEYTYLATRINVLSWNVVLQNGVILGQ